MPAAIVQSKEASAFAAATSIASGNLTSSVTAGNLLYVCVIGQADGASHNAPTDTLGHTYTQMGSTLVAAPFSPDIQLSHWYVQNCSGGTNSVTANFAGSTTLRGVLVIEVSGVRTSGAFDVEAKFEETSGGNGADVIVSGAATNTAQPAILIGVSYDIQGSIQAAGTGFTSITTGWQMDDVDANMRAEYKLLSSTGSQQATWQDTDFARHVSCMAIFLEPAAAVVNRVSTVSSPLRW